MDTRRGIGHAAAVLILFAACALASAAGAQVALRYDPADTTLAVGETCRLSIVLDEPLRVRSIDIRATYDTTIVRSLGGGAGTLYTDSGVLTFQGFEEDTLGSWHGYSVLMGAEYHIEGPGEMYFWNLEALADGTTPIATISIYMSRDDGTWFQQVLLPDGRVIVGDGTSGASDLPSPHPDLRLWPNPFNPRTEIGAELELGGPVQLAVFDLRGRRVAVLRDGHAGPGPLRAAWDGRDDRGAPAPAGTYLFRLQAPGLQRTTKGVLLK